MGAWGVRPLENDYAMDTVMKMADIMEVEFDELMFDLENEAKIFYNLILMKLEDIFQNDNIDIYALMYIISSYGYDLTDYKELNDNLKEFLLNDCENWVDPEERKKSIEEVFDKFYDNYMPFAAKNESLFDIMSEEN